jgi:hypothetical protein
MPLPTNGSAFMLSHAGQPCTAVLNNVSSSFDGILDTGTKIERDAGSQEVYPLGTRLLVQTTIANQMVEGSTKLTTGAVTYQVNSIMVEDDGYYSTCYIAPVTS